MKILKTLAFAGFALVAAAPVASAQNYGNGYGHGNGRPVASPARHNHGPQCQFVQAQGHYETQVQYVNVPGRYVVESRTVNVPGRYETTYQTVRTPGYFRNVQRRVEVPGYWTTDGSCTTGPSIQFGRGRVRFDAGIVAAQRRWVPASYRIVNERVWVEGCDERRPVRRWIAPCTRVEQVKVWKPACRERRDVKVFVPGARKFVCKCTNTRPVDSCSPTPERGRRGGRRGRLQEVSHSHGNGNVICTSTGCRISR